MLTYSTISNTRKVLFEKHQVYYYKFDFVGTSKTVKKMTDRCPVNNDCGIGSGSCSICVFNIEANSNEDYVVCRILTKVLNLKQAL